MKTIILFMLLIISRGYSQERIINNTSRLPETAGIEKKMLDAKRNGRTSEIISLQKQMDGLTGRTVTMLPERINAAVIPGSLNHFDNVAVTGITQIAGQTNIKAIATATEQGGSTSGRVWVVHTLNNGTGDALKYFYSDDNGKSWTEYVMIYLGTGIRINADELDIEIINNENVNYIYAVYGYIESSINWYTGLAIVNSTESTPQMSAFRLNWPGNSSNNYYYKPRLCSDNAAFIFGPYIYIISAMDSTISGGFLSGAKTAIIRNPFDLTPLINYSSNAYLGTGIYFEPYTYDLAYFRNTYDSILVVETGLLDSGSVQLGSSSIEGLNTTTSYIGEMPVNNSRPKTHGYIAGNGSYNKLMIVCREKYSPSLWDIRYFRSSNGAFGWTSGYVDGRFVNKSRPDIAGKRNSPGTFYCAYTTIGSFDSVFYSTATNYNWGTYVGPVNSLSSTVNNAQPRPGFTDAAGNECLNIWSAASGGVYASYGCGAIVIGISQNGTTVPSAYELKQNYPNPFNPVTNIEFSIPKQNSVKLSIYDILGNEVTVLVNKDLEAGNYKVDFDASLLASGIYFYKILAGSFTYVRKMAVVK